MAEKKVWCGDAPKTCDMCKGPIVKAFIDGVVRGGGWACMCSTCFARHGVGVGTGRGQRYEMQQRLVRECVGADEFVTEWVKVAG
jgi:hypothetical protein